MTRSELQRQIEFVQRELEELLVRIGENEPTASQRAKLSALLAQLNDLRTQMADVQQETDEKIEEKGNSFKAKWMRLGKAAEDFTTYDVKDGMFRIRFGVRFQIDATGGTESAGVEQTVGTVNRSVNFRRARIFAQGRFFRRIDYRFEWDFAIDNGLKDAWVEGSKWTKFMKWRVGRFKEPYSLDRQNSSAHMSFLEWASPVQAIAPGRGWGIMFRHNEAPRRLNWAVSLTAAGQSATDDETTSNLTLTTRLTGLPVYQGDGRTLLHLGGSYSARDTSDNVVSFSARPEARFVPDFIATGDIAAERSTVWGLEAAAVFGQFWSQAEWVQSEVPSDGLGDLTFRGSYVATGWFYTGENRFYKTADGTFGRVTPNRLFKNGNPFTKKGDSGALEFVARYSALDLNSGLVRGGAMKNYSVGMNWYLSESSEFKLNLIHSDVKDVGGANLVLLRYQFNP
jgi:phosphate-selective porin OprO/OprP